MSVASLQALADRLIDRHGRTVTFVKSGTTAVTGGKPWLGVTDSAASVAPGTETEARAAFLNYREKAIDGTIIRRGDKRCLVSGTVAGLETMNAVRDGSATWQIVACDVLEPGDGRMLYDFQVRQ